ncbi:MAG: MATE family efflux transporter [Rikenellaceae bacterium]
MEQISYLSPMNREILRIAAPNIISNITIPLMGIASTAIAGRCGGDSALSIGQLAIGVSIFNFIYMNCGFIRMGTSGITAQAYGAKNWELTTRMLYFALGVALCLGILILLFRGILAQGAVDIMGGGELSLEYVMARIWAVPAGILLFAFHGWYTGMQNATIPMVTAVMVNILHICASLYLALSCEMGIIGIAYASVFAQWVGVIVASVLLFVYYRRRLVPVKLKELFTKKELSKFFGVNLDIIIRTFCIVCVYTFFTAASARMGDATLLAVNVILLQLFTLFSYMTDGFAYAAEALTGRFIGARDRKSLKIAIHGCIKWSIIVSIIYVIIYVIEWQQLLTILVGEKADNQAIIDIAGRYIIWIIMIPIVGAFPFLMDGVMVGATFTHIMRNSMLIASAIYFGTYYAFEPFIGNNALWLAFSMFMLLRGVVQYFMTNRLNSIYDCVKE